MVSATNLYFLSKKITKDCIRNVHWIIWTSQEYAKTINLINQSWRVDRSEYSSNKFTINEDDQFDILKVERLGAEDKIDENKRFHDLLKPNECFKNVSSKDLKNAQERLQKRREIIRAKLKFLGACSGIVDLFSFGFYEYKTVDDDKYPSKPRSLAIKILYRAGIQALHSTRTARFESVRYFWFSLVGGLNNVPGSGYWPLCMDPWWRIASWIWATHDLSVWGSP